MEEKINETREDGLDLIIEANLSLQKYINTMIREGCRLLKNMRVVLTICMRIAETDGGIYYTYVQDQIRSYGVVTLFKKQINKSKEVQSVATKLIPSMKTPL